MANKTRTDILAQIYQYMPQINQTAKSTIINNCIDLAVENISMQHNFRCFRSKWPSDATLAASKYYLLLSDFDTMGSSTGYFKEVLAMFRLVSGEDEYNPVKFIDDIDFHNTFGYVSYSGDPNTVVYDATSDKLMDSEGDYLEEAQTGLTNVGAPDYYTILNNLFLFNCRTDKTYVIRVWYQKYHPPFASDATSHSFDSRDNMLAFNAIVYNALFELKSSLSTGEFPMDINVLGQLAQQYTARLIQRDVERTVQNEDFEFGVLERSTRRDTSSNPYNWI